MFRGVLGFLRRLFREFNLGLVQFTRWVGVLILRSFLGLWGWARTRSWSYLLQSVPAIAATVMVLVLFGVRRAMPAAEIEARYKVAADSAKDAGNWNAVMLCQDRLVQMGGSDAKSLYAYGLALEAMGQTDRAMKFMEQSANQGSGEAHLWIARHYFGSKQLNHQELVEMHCELALRIGDLAEHGNRARHLLGEHHFRVGLESTDSKTRNERFGQAAEQFKILVETWAHMYLRYAQILKALDRNGESDDAAAQSIKYYKNYLDKNPENLVARNGLAETYDFLGKYETSITILLKHPAADRPPIYNHSIAETYLRWHLAVVKKSPEDIGGQIDLLDKGLSYEPTNPFLLDRLLSYVSKDGKELEAATKAINLYAAKTNRTPTALFLLGMIDFKKDEPDKARKKFDEAYALANKDFPILANNYAWMLANAKREPTVKDMDYALELVNSALKNNPKEPGFLDTRATIYMRYDKQDKWELARNDLNSILRNSPEFRGIDNVRDRLSHVYDKLGDKNAADALRKLHKNN